MNFISKIIAATFGLGTIILFTSYTLLNRGEQSFIEFQSLRSPDNRHILTVNISNPSTPYGPHGVEVILKKVGDQTSDTSRQFRLLNDGAKIQSQNIEIRWPDSEYGIICLRGAEQDTVQIIVQVRERKLESKTEVC